MSKEIQVIFADFIREELDKNGVSMAQMCRDINIDYNTFNSTYRRSQTRATWLLKIADYFGVEVRDLILMPYKK